MRHGLILIAVFIAATAFTSSEYSSAFMVKPKTTTHHPKTTTAHHPKTTTAHHPKTTTAHHPNTTTAHHPKTTTTHHPKTTTAHHPKTTTTHHPKTTTHNPNSTTHNPNSTTHNPNSTTHNPNSTTHNPNSTTHNPNSTTHNPNSTTHNPNSTTHNPNSTTHNPNSTTHNPNTTTHNPNSTTHQPPTTTAPPAPTPPTNMTTGNYNVTDAKGNICILADLGIGIRVNNSEVNGTFIVQPSKTTSGGECSEKTAKIILSFDEGKFILNFKNDKTKKMVYVESVEFDLTYAFKRGALEKYAGMNKSLELFSAAPGHSYSCSAESVYMGKGVSLDLTNYRLQAFNIQNKAFGTADLCKADKPDYRVPIAVGIILIILIVIVVIAYLISRKRRSNGYQSL